MPAQQTFVTARSYLPDVAPWIARLSLRTRMLMLVAVAALPALAVFAWSELGPRRADGTDEATLIGALLVIGGALMSLGFGLIVGEHFLRRPADALLGAARNWSAGNLDARIDIAATSGAEFARIAQTFNAMAEALGRQRAQLRALNNELEQRVDSRTRELTESNRRLIAEIADRGRAEAALRQAQKLQAVGQLAGGIAHEFNNLLTTVTGALDILRCRLAAGQDSAVRLVDTALHAADRGGRLTGQLLSFSRRQRLTPVPTDLNATVLALSDLLESSLGQNIHIDTELSRGLFPAMVDPSQLETALLSLAFNARDAMPEGGRLKFATQAASIAESATLPAGEYVAISVTDTGVGMDEKTAAMVFEPFFTTKPSGTATGLGLSQVHGIIAQSGGDVRIRSVPGIGTTVMLLLPRATATLAASAGSPDARPEPARLPRNRRGRLLVVDDDAGVRDMAEAMLNECGYHVTAAESGEEALDLLEFEPAFDLLLTDYFMEGMDGLALIQAASERWPAMRSILMTGNAELTGSAPLDEDRLLLKPFNIATLDDRIARILNRPRLQVIQGGAAAD